MTSRYCKQHKKFGCKCHLPRGSRQLTQYKNIVKIAGPSLDECIIRILQNHASGRALVASSTITAQLAIYYGKFYSQRHVTRQLRRLATVENKIVKVGTVGQSVRYHLPIKTLAA